jgi:antitoxin component YwqK of YwqJK toxin-antitoxin module
LIWYFWGIIHGMKQISFFTFFTIISLSHYFSQVKIDGRKLNENNGKYYSNNNLFNGNAYFLYPNEQLKEIVEFKNGEKKGVITTYYQDENYISSSYLDSVIARNLEIKNREQKTLVDKLILASRIVVLTI